MHGGARRAALLFLGDIATFTAALWVTLFLRYREVPSVPLFEAHVFPFGLLFLLWTLVFYMSGLYGKGTILFKSRQPEALVKTQVANIVIAALFFFFVPDVGIAPKTNLLIYLVVSLLLIFLWRLALYPRLSMRRVREDVLLVGRSDEAQELHAELNGNPRYPMRVSAANSSGV